MSLTVLLAALFGAVVLGAMVFFSFAMAPLIFVKLPAEISGPFIREVFPVYYLSLAIVSLLAGAFALPTHRVEAAGLAAVGIAFVLSRQLLMPKINELRDAQLRGEPGADENAFGLLHRLSVVINYAQLVAIIAILIGLLR